MPYAGRVIGYLWRITCEYLLTSLLTLDRVYVDITNIYPDSLVTISKVIYHIQISTFFLFPTWKTFFLKKINSDNFKNTSIYIANKIYFFGTARDKQNFLKGLSRTLKMTSLSK